MMLISFVFLCFFIPLLNASPLKSGPSKNRKDLLWDHFQVKREACESGYADIGGCPSWAANNFCDVNSVYHNFMMQNCKDACGVCTAAPPPYLTPEIISFDVSECLAANNLNRSKHGAPALQWDSDLASGSAEWSLYLANSSSVQHSTGSYGENIYYSWTSVIGTVATCKKAVESWYSEIELYDFGSPGFSSATGHFTQVVWKSTTKVGVGIAAVTKNGLTYTYVTARYTPAGNVQGSFSANVLAASK